MIVEAFPSILELSSEAMAYVPMVDDGYGNRHHRNYDYSADYWRQIKEKIKRNFSINHHDTRILLKEAKEEN